MVKSSVNPLKVGVIGGGAAGMSCALWLKHLGYTPIIIEQHGKLGGQLLYLNRVNRWVLGSPNKTSAELAVTYAAHINSDAISVKNNARLVAVTTQQTGYDLIIGQDGQANRLLSVRALVVATGARVLTRELFGGIPGFHSLHTANLISFFPFGHLDKLASLHGKTVAIIGGGDNAHFTAKDIALAGARVYLLMRSRPKARNIIRTEIESLIEQGAVIECTWTQISAFRQHQNGIEITLNKPDAVIEKINVDMVFARTGFTANTEFLDAFHIFSGIAKENGYLNTDNAKRTSIPWVYAIGDVAHSNHQSVASAIADGAIAAQDLSGRE